MKTSRSSSASKAAPQRYSLLGLGLWLACMAAGAQPASPQRLEAARLLTEDAAMSLSMGYVDAAAAQASGALAVYPGSSDACYLAALILEAAGAPAAYEIDYLERAVAGGNFRRYKQEDARLRLAALYARTGNPAQALGLLASLPTGPEVLYLKTSAAIKAADLGSAGTALTEAAARYPRDARAALAYLAAARLRGQPDRTLLDLLFRNLPALKESDPSILVYLAPYAATAEASRLMLREYRAQGGASALATLLALRYGLIDELKAAPEPFSGAYEPDQHILAELASSLSSPEGGEALRKAMAAYSGRLGADADGDGVPESLAVYKAGQLVSWEHDPDQDGRVELSLSFEESAPAHALARMAGALMAVRFGPWPHAASVSVSRLAAPDAGLAPLSPPPHGFLDPPAESVRLYTIPYGAFPMPLVRLEPLPGAGSGPYLVSVAAEGQPAELALAQAASSVDTRFGGRIEHAELFGAVPERSYWMDQTGAGGQLLYSLGKPRLEYMDLDGDGRQESRRQWVMDGEGLPVPERLDMDMDGDGVYEYRSRLMEPLLDTWDLDADGLPDLGYERLPDGSERRSFSAGRDGRLDTRLTLMGGRPVAAERDGAALALVPDSGGRVLWLGKKPFDFGPDLPEPGMHYRGSTRYVVLALGSLLLAEAVP